MFVRSIETKRTLEIVRFVAGRNDTGNHPPGSPQGAVCWTEQHVPLPHVHNGRDLLVVRDGDWIVKDPDAGFYPMPDELIATTFEEITSEVAT